MYIKLKCKLVFIIINYCLKINSYVKENDLLFAHVCDRNDTFHNEISKLLCMVIYLFIGTMKLFMFRYLFILFP